MQDVGHFVAIGRTIHFVRHLRLQSIMRRIWLDIKRRLLSHLRRISPAPPPCGLALRLDRFEPLFAPRQCAGGTTTEGFVFSFLGRSVHMARDDIDWSAEVSPPVSQLWRMNLHYTEFLGGFHDNDFITVVDQWITANRPYANSYWLHSWNAYALSIRSIVWIEELARRKTRLPRDFVARICDSLAEQLTFLARNIETDIGGNHLIKNIRALATGARVFDGPDATRWRELALELIKREIDTQILADGMHFERSPSYHGQIFADLLAIRVSLNDEPEFACSVRQRLDGALAAMAQAVADLKHPDGRVALFNDAGIHMSDAPDELLTCYARIFGRDAKPRDHFSFHDAGYFGFRNGGLYVAVDCGRLGPDVLMAHAHADALAFELSADGQRFVVDQGVFEYAAGERRAAARACRSHNTLAIEGLDQAAFFSSFRCGDRPDVEVTEYIPTANGFRLAGRHDGFVRTGRGPIHHRRFELTDRQLSIHDRIDRPTARAVSSSVLLHPACVVDRAGNAIVVRRDTTQVTIDATVPIELESAVYWPDLGVEESTRRLRFVWPPGSQEATIRLTISECSSPKRA
jgi:uncharacterized heparinase superfamily protein